MLRRNDGYYLVELLLSLSTWLIICIFLLPLVKELREQTNSLQLQNTAVHLLYDEMESQIDEINTANKTFFLNGTSFEIKWSSDMSKTEVCVEYSDVHSNKKTKCQSPK